MERRRIDDLATITINYMVAAAFGLLLVRGKGETEVLFSPEWTVPALSIGVLFIILYLIMIRSAITSGITITAVASRMSVIIPVLAGFWLFHDAVSLLKLLGIALALLSFFLVLKPPGKFNTNYAAIFLPVLLMVGIGFNDTLMKYMQVHFISGREIQFLVVVYFASLIVGVILLGLKLYRKGILWNWPVIPAGVLLGLLNFGSTLFLLRAMSTIESSVLFPVFNIGVIILSALTGIAFFRERLRKLNWVGLGLAAIAIYLITSGR